jgi:hypothetical protein
MATSHSRKKRSHISPTGLEIALALAQGIGRCAGSGDDPSNPESSGYPGPLRRDSNRSRGAAYGDGRVSLRVRHS